MINFLSLRLCLANVIKPLLVIICLMNAFAFSSAQAEIAGLTLASDDTFLNVDQAFELSSQITPDELIVNITIAPQYYLYKNKVKISANGKQINTIELPLGETHVDEYFGEQYIYRDNLRFSVPIALQHELSQLEISYQGCADKGLCYPPQKVLLSLGKQEQEQVFTNAITPADISNSIEASPAVDEQGFKGFDIELGELLASNNFLLIVFMFFLLGLGLSFTPCVFPMYPILTGIIVGQGDKLSLKKAFLLSFTYVQGMAITYTSLGIVVAFAGMQFQAAFQHPAVLISLSILFVFLALSMFGVFNLALPSTWQAKINNLSNKQKGGSLVGVLVMGIISGLVASPCTTAPLTAALIYIAQSGDVAVGALALYALSMGMGLPLIILGSSGGKLLPKAGAWMNIIKNVFGFLLLAVPILLLERILPEFYAQILWVLLALTFSTYLYVNNRRAQSDFWYGLRSLFVFIFMFSAVYQGHSLIAPQEEKAEKHLFKKVSSLAELNSQISLAKSANKTVIVDLYADWCIACKEFEKYTFADPKVKQLMNKSMLIQIDLTDTGSPENEEFMAYFNVTGLPTILLFDASGKELTSARITGYLNAEAFSQHIKSKLN